jgi:AraC family transcriptional regulator of adaptative response/methylated-DNA-[protein]-cysteine methyltransferase
MKKQLRRLLQDRDFDGVAVAAGRKRRALGVLTSLTFDADPQTSWRAVGAMGVAAQRIAEDDPEYVREHVRRLYWLLSEESGGVCWRSPEAMAEIVRRMPRLLADFVPIVVNLIVSLEEEDLRHFRPGVLWAIGRLGGTAGEHIQPVLPAIIAALDHADPQVRGMAVWCLGQVAQGQRLAGRRDLLLDEGQVDLYEDGSVNRTRVGELVRRVLAGGSASG